MSDNRMVLDIETKKTFDEVGGRAHMDKVGISVVGVYLYATDEYQVYEEKEMGALQNVLIDSSLIVGFNHEQFDLPVMQPYFSIDLSQLPTFDIMIAFQEKLGHRVGLDSVAKATLGRGKTGHGLDAIRYWREGRIDELKKYCLNDVKVTKEVLDYGVENSRVSYIAKYGGDKKTIEVDWSSHGPVINEAEAANNFSQYKLF